MTTTPRIDTVFTSSRIASTAAPSPPSLSPRPTQRPAAMAPASVTRTNSMARLRSGASPRARAGDAPATAVDDEPGPNERSPSRVMAVILPEADPSAGAGLWAVITGWDTHRMTEEPQPNADVAGEPLPAPGPAPRPAKPRLLQDGRDMFWSLAPL